jgi:hypothetical protein
MANKSINNVPITQQEVRMILSIPMGSAWMKSHPNSLQAVPEAKDLFASIRPNTIKQQNNIAQACQLIGVAFVTSLQKYPVLFNNDWS